MAVTATTQEEARAMGLKRFFTGVPCKRGHLVERFVSDRGCVECKAMQAAKWREEHPEEIRKMQNKCNEKRRESQREYRQRTRDQRREAERKWQASNREKCREYTKKWRERNPEKRAAYLNRPDIKAKMKEVARKWAQDNPDRRGLWAKKNPERRRAISGRRYAKKKLALVPWADQQKIAAIYAESERLTRETGIPHEVDHIYPIQGKTVTGLHHEDNLRVVPRHVNRAKGNRLPEEAA